MPEAPPVGGALKLTFLWPGGQPSLPENPQNSGNCPPPSYVQFGPTVVLAIPLEPGLQCDSFVSGTPDTFPLLFSPPLLSLSLSQSLHLTLY